MVAQHRAGVTSDGFKHNGDAGQGMFEAAGFRIVEQDACTPKARQSMNLGLRAWVMIRKPRS